MFCKAFDAQAQQTVAYTHHHPAQLATLLGIYCPLSRLFSAKIAGDITRLSGPKQIPETSSVSRSKACISQHLRNSGMPMILNQTPQLMTNSRYMTPLYGAGLAYDCNWIVSCQLYA